MANLVESAIRRRVYRRFAILAACFAALAVLSAAAPGRIWTPAQHTTWQWQLTTPVRQSVQAQMFDIDLFDNSASVVAALHRRGRHVICYLDAGTIENYRADTGRFPTSVQGKTNGWPGERWLDIRNLSALEPIMRARFSLCKRKGFDGVEADNVDGYANDTGFPLTAADQLTYNRWLARTAHSFGLSIALKNDLDQVPALERYFDFALDEQCFEYTECDKLRPFVAAHKAVFEVEYNLSPDEFCAQANALGFMSMRKTLDLGVNRQVCW
ncbi:MAG: endo alpha-1,4 polygalactosaminidase [Solirubrobacterales bacterium]|nr:endo alpha-1,4 polygalactosaminidase [Solirubrobacterales bacterium]